MAARTNKPGDGSKSAEQREVAAYVAALSADLSGMARRNGLTTLAYLLDMVRLEADTTARSDREPPARASAPGFDVP